MGDAKKLTNEYRLRHWAALIQERMRSGKSIDQWCAEHDLSRNVYYYWLRKVRLSTVYDTEGQTSSDVSDLPKIVPLIPPQQPAFMSASGTAITINMGGLTLEVKEGASLEIIERTLEALKQIC